ncbi:hypothetical protein [Gordonia rubripertincta]|uniref:Uncharacterized protein n=1 Tax=Gordonia rubripertincta TaxID=36822 RepID=A0ABT4MZM5_GORRU|nr:hypothetical protein [Gordonia rubripertincta]MCZ4552264.1 hypothetical protein [Gordonia rubripertincta]
MTTVNDPSSPPTQFHATIIADQFIPEDNESKRKIILSLVWVLAGLAAISIVGTIVLVGMSKDVTAVAPFVTLIIGGLIGLFAPSPTGGQ